MRLVSFAYATIAMASVSSPAMAQTVVKHPSPPPALILQSVTVKPGATTLYLSGQLAAPLDPTKKVPPAQLSIADFGDTKTQTVSVLGKIKAILAEHGYTMADLIKLTVFVAGDPKLGNKMDFAGMNDGFKQFFGTADNPATVARSTVQVAALAGPAFLVEIEATAAK
ncbi:MULTISPECIES: RidA family protein [unclassified Sphingomonas]|jgi:2-iminobutanoate/2-iminopropanoate deaminase|uniref:RidA family protein n=1 Tax=unclassified Sphingomonas TaxID=196159 RepID=UPI000E10578A|nr:MULTISPECIES: RidA family protein [unclassified Sphingomonas]AXJ94924.1 endonuclease [Sphingomonas sp. FARSPH]